MDLSVQELEAAINYWRDKRPARERISCTCQLFVALNAFLRQYDTLLR
ncbi:DUF3717 domain-containing protein [Massilia sp. B-10]|nr:DUF3717 domain-containing protein [Massilia sp. B-10]